MNHISDRQGTINRIRRLVKLEIIRRVGRVGCVCSKCKKQLGLDEVDLDEIGGRHTVSDLPGVLNPENMQLLDRLCHGEKTNAGHVDYRDRKTVEKMHGFANEIRSFLPPKSENMKHRLEDIEIAVIRAIGKRKGY